MSFNKFVASAKLESGVNTQAHLLIEPEVAEVTSPGEAERLIELRRHGITDGGVVSANRVAETMFEVESSQSMGKSIAGLISGKDAVAGDGVWTRSVHGKGSRKEATKFPIEVSRSRWTDAEGSTASDALGRASGRIAHKLNNLMQPIIGLTQLELDQLPDEGTAEQMDSRGNLAMILASSRQTLEVIRKVLMFARRAKPELTPVDFPAALNRAITSFGKLLPRGVHVEQLIDAAAVGVATINDTELTEVMANLAVNAADAMGGNGVLTIRLDRIELTEAAASLGIAAGSWFRISVADTGNGMDAETKAQIFEPFFTTKPIGQRTGLGLAITYGVLRDWKGAIAVDSMLGCGSTFTLYIPVTPT